MIEKMERIYIQTSRLRFKKFKGFIYKQVIQELQGEKDLHTNQSLKLEKLQMIYIQTSRLRFKRWKEFTYKLVV